MKYYLLKFNSGLINEMGKYPQSETTLEVPYNTNDLGYEGPVVASLTPPQPILSNMAKLTTILYVISLNPRIFILCKKFFIEFLKDFSLGENRTWPMTVHHNSKILEDYMLFHLSHTSDDAIIDYKKSKFSIGEIGDWRDKSKRKKTIVENYSNYLSLRDVLRDSGTQIKHEKIVLDMGKAHQDLFRLETPSVRGYYFSEKLKKAIEKQGFTGFRFVEIEN